MGFKMSIGCTYGVFKFLVVGLDVRSMNKVHNLTALYIFIFLFSYYTHLQNVMIFM